MGSSVGSAAGKAFWPGTTDTVEDATRGAEGGATKLTADSFEAITAMPPIIRASAMPKYGEKRNIFKG